MQRNGKGVNDVGVMWIENEQDGLQRNDQRSKTEDQRVRVKPKPRARGRSGKILKPFSRVRILVAEKIEEKVQEKVKENDKKKNIDKQPNEEKK